MSLYLCIYEGDRDVDGLDVGKYSDFETFRDTICDRLESGRAGSRFGTLMLHSDCDGQWSPPECALLLNELAIIRAALSDLPPEDFSPDWQAGVRKTLGLRPASLLESFIDVDGEPLVDRLMQLAQSAVARGLPISFQ